MIHICNMASEELMLTQALINLVQRGWTYVPGEDPYFHELEYIPPTPDGTGGNVQKQVVIALETDTVDPNMLSSRQQRKGHVPFMQIVPSGRNSRQNPHQQAH